LEISTNVPAIFHIARREWTDLPNAADYWRLHLVFKERSSKTGRAAFQGLQQRRGWTAAREFGFDILACLCSRFGFAQSVLSLGTFR